jgi:hypothetical protein
MTTMPEEQGADCARVEIPPFARDARGWLQRREIARAGLFQERDREAERLDMIALMSD